MTTSTGLCENETKVIRFHQKLHGFAPNTVGVCVCVCVCVCVGVCGPLLSSALLRFSERNRGCCSPDLVVTRGHISLGLCTEKGDTSSVHFEWNQPRLSMMLVCCFIPPSVQRLFGGAGEEEDLWERSNVVSIRFINSSLS